MIPKERIFQRAKRAYSARSTRGILATQDKKYLLKEKIQEDSRTRTFAALDMELNRPVHYVQLRKMGEVKYGRSFLLKARMLGKLKHPGLLPLHDMGVEDERYFYTTRVPPGKSLRDVIQLGKKGRDTGLNKNSTRILQVLAQLSDSLAYLHGQNVTLGGLSSDGVFIGNFGEVIITDFSRAVQHDPQREQEAMKSAIVTDLQVLAELGLRMWNESSNTQPYAIREWDSTAQALPLEVQEVFDKAYLQRGGAYPSAKALRRDMYNLLDGNPPESRKGDLLFTLKGLFHHNRKVVLLGLIVVLLSLIVLTLKQSPLNEIESRIDVLTDSLPHEEQKISTMGNLIMEKKMEVKKVEEQLRLAEEKIRMEKKAQEQLAGAQEESNKSLQNLENEIIIERDRTRKIEMLKDELNESIAELQHKLDNNPLEEEEVDNQKLVRESIPITTAMLASPLQRKWLFDSLNIPQGSWLHRYVGEGRDHPSLAQRYPLNEEAPTALHPQLPRIAWFAEGRFYMWDLSKPAPSSTTTDFIPSKSLAFVGPDSWLAIHEEQWFHLQLQGETLEVQGGPMTKDDHILPIYSPNSIHSSSSERVSSGNLSDILFQNERESLRIPSDSLDLLHIPQHDGLFRVTTQGIHSLTHRFEILHFESSPEDWGLHWGQALHVLHEDQLRFYRWSNEPDEGPTPLRIPNLPAPTGIDSVTFSPGLTDLWVIEGTGVLHHWDLSQKGKQTLQGVKGSALLANHQKLITRSEGELLLYQMDRQHDRLPLSPTPESILNWLRDLPDASPTDLVWGRPQDPYLILAKGGTHIEIWDTRTHKRLHLGIAGSPISQLAYHEKLNCIVTLDARGEAQFW